MDNLPPKPLNILGKTKKIPIPVMTQKYENIINNLKKDTLEVLDLTGAGKQFAHI